MFISQGVHPKPERARALSAESSITRYIGIFHLPPGKRRATWFRAGARQQAEFRPGSRDVPFFRARPDSCSRRARSAEILDFSSPTLRLVRLPSFWLRNLLFDMMSFETLTSGFPPKVAACPG